MIPRELKRAVYERDGCCVVCGTGLNADYFEAHHRRYKSRGGKDELCNLIACCQHCHRVAIHEDHTGLATANGWAVSRSGSGPANVPVRYADGSLRYLTNLESAA